MEAIKTKSKFRASSIYTLGLYNYNLDNVISIDK